MSRVARVVGMVVLAVGLAGCWPAPGQNADRTAFNDLESGLGQANVGQLTQRWVWTSPDGRNVQGAVASTAGVHVPSGGCHLATIDAATGALSWDADLSTHPDAGPGLCSITTLGDPFVADGRVWVGRHGVIIQQGAGQLLIGYANLSTLGFDLDGTPDGTWSGAMLDNLRGELAHGVGGHIDTITLPPPFPPVFQYVFVQTVSIGQLGTEWHTVQIPAEIPPTLGAPGGTSALGGRTLGTSALYDAGAGLLATAPGDTATGNGLRAFALTGATPGCGSTAATFDCPIWATALDGTNTWQPVIGDSGATLYAGTDAGTVYAVDSATGAVRWSAPVGSAVTGSVALAGDTVYVPTASGDLVALAAGGCGAATCTPVWSGATGSSVSQQPAVANGVVYTASGDGSLHAFAADGCGGEATCPALWSHATGHQISDAPIVSSGRLYVTFNADSADTTGKGGLLAFGLP